jgi:hypothetical protein
MVNICSSPKRRAGLRRSIVLAAIGFGPAEPPHCSSWHERELDR